MRKSQFAFTLIELLVVIAIFGLLASIVLVITRGSTEKAALSMGKQFSQSLQNTLGSETTAAWDFEVTGGIIKDSSGNGNDGAVYGATQVEGVEGSGLQFDGNDDYVTFSKPFFSSMAEKFTISLWAKPLATPAENGVIFFHAQNGNFMVGYATDNTFFFSFKKTSGEWYGVASQNKHPAGKWYNVVGSFDKDKNYAKIIVNGKAEGQVQPNSPLFDPVGTPSLGAMWRPWYIASYFNGVIDEVRLYATGIE